MDAWLGDLNVILIHARHKLRLAGSRLSLRPASGRDRTTFPFRGAGLVCFKCAEAYYACVNFDIFRLDFSVCIFNTKTCKPPSESWWWAQTNCSYIFIYHRPWKQQGHTQWRLFAFHAWFRLLFRHYRSCKKHIIYNWNNLIIVCIWFINTSWIKYKL